MADEQKKLEEFWKSPEGISIRVDNLAQVFSFRIVNNAFKVIAPTNDAKWMKWILHPERSKTGPCLICIAKSQGGRDGYYRVTWFTPAMPQHDRCVCEWEIVFERPTLGKDEIERSRELLSAHKARYRPL